MASPAEASTRTTVRSRLRAGGKSGPTHFALTRPLRVRIMRLRLRSGCLSGIACRRCLGRLARLRLGRLARGVAEIPEEVGIRLEQEAGVAALQAGFIGRHRAVEGEEIGVLAIGFRKQTVALGVALAADLLGLR